MNINIKVIPHSTQRYETVGDYFWDDEWNLHIIVSDLDNQDMENCIAIHEFVEAILARKRGISEESITKFDKDFEDVRNDYPITIGDMEPGDMVSAPYFKEHQVATLIEKKLAEELGVNWEIYTDTCNKLYL